MGKVVYGESVVVEGMVKASTLELEQVFSQISKMLRTGVELVRVGAVNLWEAENFKEIKKKFPELPLMADVHFDWRIAQKAVEAGFEAVRINPANMSESGLKNIVSIAKERDVALRVGVNAGGFPSERSVETLVDVCVDYVKKIEDLGHNKIIVSVKLSDPFLNYQANKLLREKTPYPIHAGLTEAGPPPEGIIKSTIALQMLLRENLADAVRVSLTAPPELETEVAWWILQFLKIRRRWPEIISCPTCTRQEVDVKALVDRIKEELAGCTKPIKIAVLGCVVNGIGEGAHADFGIAGGRGHGILFSHGKIIDERVPENQLVERLVALVRKECGV